MEAVIPDFSWNAGIAESKRSTTAETGEAPEGIRGTIEAKSSRPAGLHEVAVNRGPVPAQYHQEVIDVVRNGGLGDVLMCTPGLRELKRANPNSKIRFYTYWGEVVDGLPYISEVLPTRSAPPNAVQLDFGQANPPYAHIARVYGDSLRVDVRDVRPDCVVRSDLVRQFQEVWQELPRPHIVISRHASSWTPNKDWPDANWEELIVL